MRGGFHGLGRPSSSVAGDRRGASSTSVAIRAALVVTIMINIMLQIAGGLNPAYIAVACLIGIAVGLAIRAVYRPTGSAPSPLPPTPARESALGMRCPSCGALTRTVSDGNDSPTYCGQCAAPLRGTPLR